MNASSFVPSRQPSVRSPVHRSTPNGRTVRIASATFSGVRPPARNTGTGEAATTRRLMDQFHLLSSPEAGTSTT